MRRMNGLGALIFIAVLLLIEYYAFSALKFAVRSAKPVTRSWILGVYAVVSLLWIATLVSFPMIRTAEMSQSLRNVLISFAMGFLIAKLAVALILGIDDIRRFLYSLAGLFFQQDEIPGHVIKGMSRSQFLNRAALLFGGSLFGVLLYGMSNRYNYQVKKIKLAFDNLPNPFKGLKIVQISDIHSGSLNNLAGVRKGIEMIMAQKPDIIFFTGDLVNNKSEEMDDHMDVFSALKAPMGVYSILGNHDYGDYVEWESEASRQANLNRLKSIHQQLGWRLLLNEHIVLEREGQQIGVIGVENISSKRFHSYGDLAKAYQGAEALPFKILLSHDPSHWDGETNQKFQDIDLTLSGHTHGMQFGVEIPGLRWSPVQYFYKQWAGVYQQGKQFLYVNRGFGFLGYPGRV
ncbi:MAG TPA: metallophosphoesterase, partial [Chitinophagaceae bacterium]|nr:metallophosphoesterase [Chitinophagaceae bacterium]